mmetsp:Transcript_8914/g.27047  ORF Transcript_8914/g.27047 Transcript_8914/m.27047 type:complete len:462 (-) Transcript_8914:41-1426(-)
MGGPKGGGKGPAPPPRPPPMRPAKAAPATAQPPQAAGVSMADALASHKFRRMGVETHVTPRVDVEAAFAKLVPNRIRQANATWKQNYGGAEPSRPTADADSAAGRRRKAVSFADESAGLVEIVEVVPSNPAPACPAPRSWGAGIAKTYRLALAARWTVESAVDNANSWPPLPPGHDPDVIWRTLEPSQRILEAPNVFVAEPGVVLPPCPRGSVRFVCISDTHGLHRELTSRLPRGDVLLHGGDFTRVGEFDLVKDFGLWLRSLPFARKFVVAGNHDLCFDRRRPMEPGQGQAILAEAGGETVEYLEEAEAMFRGLRLFGCPWQPEFGERWAFGLPRGPAMAERWAAVPAGVDVLLTHSPPLGRGDLCNHGGRAGCADLLAAVQARLRPAFCVFGHIHEDAGASSDGVTSYLNASSCDFAYKCTRHPLVFDLPERAPPDQGQGPGPLRDVPPAASELQGPQP